MNNQHLYGTLALVRPDLPNERDPFKGEVGVLTYVDKEDKVYLTFPKGGENRYEAKDLLQLRDTQHLPGISQSGEQISVQDYKDLYKIDLLQKMGRSTDLLRALEIASRNPNLWERTLQSVESQLEVKQTLAYSR